MNAALRSRALLALVAVVALGAFVSEGRPAAPEPLGLNLQGKVNRYIGAQKCKTCHDKDETGNQHKQWLESKHAKAFAGLATERALAIAKEKGLGDPQKEAACIKCHQTGHGLPEAHIMKGFDFTIGVQCETCHGPGEQHMLARMKAARNKVEGYPEIPAGEIVTLPTGESCKVCHNPESPTFQPFCKHERMTEVAHWNPKKPRTDEEKKGYPCDCDEDCVCKKDQPDHKCRSVK